MKLIIQIVIHSIILLGTIELCRLGAEAQGEYRADLLLNGFTESASGNLINFN